MNVGKVGLNTPIYSNPIGFRGDNNSKPEFENPVSRSTERNLAILSASAGSVVTGVLAGGISAFCSQKGSKTPYWIGAGVALGALAITLPPAIYNRKVSAFVKQKEMDVFTRDRDLKSNLTEEVDNEVRDEKVSLDKKLDDNLKLQMANRGAAIGIANVTSQQG